MSKLQNDQTITQSNNEIIASIISMTNQAKINKVLNNLRRVQTSVPNNMRPRIANKIGQIERLSLFKPVENVEFPTLAEHWVKVRWDAEYSQLIPDYEYTDDRAMELNKQLKKARKIQKGN
jgi:hypothetical protein